jgi:hypothetical protein
MLRVAGFEAEQFFNLTRPDRFSCVASHSMAPAGARDDDPLADARRDLAALAPKSEHRTPLRLRAARANAERATQLRAEAEAREAKLKEREAKQQAKAERLAALPEAERARIAEKKRLKKARGQRA